MPTVTTPYVTAGNRQKQNSGSTATSGGRRPTGVSPTVGGSSNLPWYMNPSANARPDTQYSWQPYLDQTRSLTPAQQAAMQMGVRLGTQTPGQQPAQNQYYASGGRGGGGGGGGGGVAPETGLDQATLDWLFGQLGRGKPQDLAFNALDLPDPRTFYGDFDTSLYDQAGQGVTAGIEAMRGRGNQAFDFALGELGRYQDPYAAGPQQQNPYLYNSMQAMANANGSMGALHGAVGEGAQADRAMGNAYALMSANDRSRNEANQRAIEGDRRTMESNLGLEGNLLGLGVNMAKAKGKSAWEQMLAGLGFETASQEAAQNWQRQNTVGDTNVGNRNAWNQNMINTLLQIVGSKAPSAVLPAGWAGGYV